MKMSERERQQKGVAEAASLNCRGLPEHPLLLKLGASRFMELTLLRQNLEKVAAPDTAYDPAGYNRECPLSGHCAAVSFIVRQRYGGDIISARVNGEPHQWNRLSDGHEIDLTGEQFGMDGITAVTDWGGGIEFSNPKKVPERKSVNKRFATLNTRVKALES